jgi:hypothetical protein
MGKRIDLTGKRFSRLVAIEDCGKQNGHRLWLCQCECGNKAVVATPDLRSGATRSCGCLCRATSSTLNRTHGLSKTPEYHAWYSMMARCYRETSHAYQYYGGRGIRICERWKVFEYFYLDMCPRPNAKDSVDRIDNSGHYSCGHCAECAAKEWPSNCKWASRLEQARNRRSLRLFSVGGQEQCLAALCAQYGAWDATVRRRLKRGVSIEQALGITA